MRIPRVYFDGDLTVGSETELSKEQAHYLGRVLRLKPNREILLFNGRGGEYLARVLRLDGKRGMILVREYRDIDTESPVQTCLAISLSKGDRFDWAIQKATELGVSRIQPLSTERTEVRLSADRLLKKLSHWQGIVRSACEQSGRTRIPVLQGPISLDDFLSEQDAGQIDVGFILDPEAKESLPDISPPAKVKSLSLIVGPEGGLSQNEIDAATQAGYRGVRMGPRVLRTETAPIAALAVIQSRFGDW